MIKEQLLWREERIYADGESQWFFVSAELEDGQWNFWERSAWETTWSPMTPSPHHWQRLAQEWHKSKKAEKK